LKVTMMDAALKYAEANIPVIPLHWICEDGSCSCKRSRQKRLGNLDIRAGAKN